MSAGGAAAGASAASAAAAAEELRQRQEEEELTPYNQTDLDEDWEFKILRSATGRFKNSEFLQQVLEEEQLAGWRMIEKFDNQRIRLKRRTSAADDDSTLDFDPYRTDVGVSEPRLVLLVVALLLGAVFAAVGAAVFIAN